MKNLKFTIAFIWVVTLVAVACKKPSIDGPTHLKMNYTNLHNHEIKNGDYYQFDIDSNGSNDFHFSTLLVGDPARQRDRLQFLAGSKLESNLLNNEQDESPKMNIGDRIGAQHAGFNWFQVSSILLAEKLIPVNEAPYWDGIWKRASHNFLPVQLIRQGKPYYGWIELSCDMNNEKLVLHKAAISTEASKEVRAGY